MKLKIALLPLLFIFFGCASVKTNTTEKKITTIDFVKIIDNNRDEAIFYYQKNWKVLREMAIAKDYIDSFELFETTSDNYILFEKLLITTCSKQ